MNAVLKPILQGFATAMGAFIALNYVRNIYAMGYIDGHKSGVNLCAKKRDNVITPTKFRKPKKPDESDKPAC
jgi:hypothetical protein